MLQLRTASWKALDIMRSEREFPPARKQPDDIERVTDDFMHRFHEVRRRVSAELGGWYLVEELLDNALRTGENELMDSECISELEKLRVVRALDRQNSVMGIYAALSGIILPCIREAARRSGSEARVLELAGGTGGFALALAAEAGRQGLQVSITSSDIVPAYIEEGRRAAAEHNLPVEFIMLDALDPRGFGDRKADIVVMSQSLHHFTPGQLAVIIARSARHASTAFFGIDGYRSLLLTAGVPLVAGLQAIPSFAVDGLISARKFYSEAELGIIADLAAGEGRSSVRCSWPLSVLTVMFGSGAGIDYL